MSVKIKILGKSVSVESAREIWLELDQIFDFVPHLPDFEFDDEDYQPPVGDLDLSDDGVGWMTSASDEAMKIVDFARSRGFYVETIDGETFWKSDGGLIANVTMEEMHKDYLFEL
mgnify:CR=1 FL=1|tara:strand:+ start:167 stop:511 length:345 start_codon:yes stop_codon:yes gene_type:complete